jgi:retron-type reverse transcriptase
MTESSMFEKIISVDNLRKAWIKAYQYSRTDDVFFDEYAYSVFADHLEARLLLLSKELSEGTYQPSPLRYITIPKGNKERKIYFLSPKDTVVIQAVINIIGSDFEQTFINESYGYRLNINIQESKDVYHSWQEKYSEYVATVRGFVKYGLSSYYLITDIENYYPTISQDWLIGLISSKVDGQTLELIELFIRNTVINSSEEIESLTGIPAGVIYSHFFANIYLDDFDHRAQKLTPGYARYVDDICLVCGSLEELERTKKELSDYLDRWKQKFKEFEKTTIQPIYNIEPLLEHTRKMKYAVRLDVIETHEESSEAISMVQETEKPFYRLYKIAEREGDLGQIVNQAGLIIALLKAERDVDLADIIYSLLETHPVRPSTLKAALIYLLEIEHSKPSKRFRDFFFGEQKRSDYILTLFLRLLPHFEWEDDFKDEILSLCNNDQSYLVRSTAYFTLSQKKIAFDEELFDEMILREKSIYARSRLLVHRKVSL